MENTKHNSSSLSDISFLLLVSFIGTVSNRYNVRNEESSRHTGLYVCSQPRRPWSEMWQQMQWFQ